MSDTGLVLNSYTQYGKGNVPESTIPDDGKQAVDLDEFYRESKQDMVDQVVDGMEAFVQTGLLSKRLAGLYRMEKTNELDPIPSKRNLAVVGAEGFFSAVRDGIMAFIEMVIRYVKMAINWAINAVRSILGLQKSERQLKVIAKATTDIRKEFEGTMRGLGFPDTVFDIHAFTKFVSSKENRSGNVSILVSKLTTEEEAVAALEKVGPMFEKAISEMNTVINQLTQNYKTVSKEIGQAKSKLRSRSTDGHAEVNLIKAAIASFYGKINFKEIPATSMAIIKELFKIEFDDEELKRGFQVVRDRIGKECQIIVANTQHDPGPFIAKAAEFNARYAACAVSDNDLGSVKFAEVNKIITMDDAAIIRELASMTGDNEIVTMYQSLAASVQQSSGNFTIILQTLVKSKQQIDSIVNWYARSLITFYAYIYRDIDTVMELNKSLRAQGMGQHADEEGIPQNLVVLDEYTAQTFREKTFANYEEIMKNDIFEMKTKINRAAKQCGLGTVV